ncbi:hypothetical protein COOONC_22941 [Cooperia oncophora]
MKTSGLTPTIGIADSYLEWLTSPKSVGASIPCFGNDGMSAMRIESGEEFLFVRLAFYEGVELKSSTEAAKKLRDHRVSMTEVPERYSCLPEGTRFLQYSSEGHHIYLAAA